MPSAFAPEGRLFHLREQRLVKGIPRVSAANGSSPPVLPSESWYCVTVVVAGSECRVALRLRRSVGFVVGLRRNRWELCPKGNGLRLAECRRESDALQITALCPCSNSNISRRRRSVNCEVNSAASRREIFGTDVCATFCLHTRERRCEHGRRDRPSPLMSSREAAVTCHIALRKSRRGIDRLGLDLRASPGGCRSWGPPRQAAG